VLRHQRSTSFVAEPTASVIVELLHCALSTM
jgi:hypothetical protein